MKILLVGNGHRQNRGCEAITLTTIDLLRKNIPEVEIEFLSVAPEIDKYFEAFKVEVSMLRNDSTTIPNLSWRIKNKLGLISIENKARYNSLLPYIKKLETCDLVLSLGGDNYSDDYGIPYRYWDLGIWAKKYNVPFVIWGASVGPFRSKKSLSAAKRGLKSVSLITAREDISVKYLKSIKYNGEIVRVFDSAFILGMKKVPFPEFSRKAEIVGFNISPIYYRYTSKSYDEVLSVCRNFLNKVSEQYNILLVPHVVWDKAYNNDAVYMGSIVKKLNNVFLSSPDYDCMQLKYLISKCDFFVGARTHATIAALSSAIPTLSLGYSIKARGLNEDLFDSDEFLLESKDFNIDNFLEKFNYLVRKREKSKKCLIEKKSMIEIMVNGGIKSLLKLL